MSKSSNRAALLTLVALAATSCGLSAGIESATATSTTFTPPTTDTAVVDVVDPISSEPTTGAPTGPVVGEVEVPVTEPADAITETPLLPAGQRGTCLYQALVDVAGGVPTLFIEDSLVPNAQVDLDTVMTVLAAHLVPALRECPGVDGGTSLATLHGTDAIDYATAVFSEVAQADIAAYVAPEEEVGEPTTEVVPLVPNPAFEACVDAQVAADEDMAQLLALQLLEDAEALSGSGVAAYMNSYNPGPKTPLQAGTLNASTSASAQAALPGRASTPGQATVASALRTIPQVEVVGSVAGSMPPVRALWPSLIAVVGLGWTLLVHRRRTENRFVPVRSRSL